MEARPIPQRKPTYTVAEVAELMNVSQQNVRKQIRRYEAGDKGPRSIPGRVMGTSYRVMGWWVEQWLRADEPQPVRSNAGWS